LYYLSDTTLYIYDPKNPTTPIETYTIPTTISFSSPLLGPDGSLYCFGAPRGIEFQLPGFSGGLHIYKNKKFTSIQIAPSDGFISSPLLINGVIYCLSQNGYLVALNLDGSQKYSPLQIIESMGENFISSPIIDFNGHLVCCSSNNIYIVDLKIHQVIKKIQGDPNYIFLSSPVLDVKSKTFFCISRYNTKIEFDNQQSYIYAIDSLYNIHTKNISNIIQSTAILGPDGYLYSVQQQILENNNLELNLYNTNLDQIQNISLGEGYLSNEPVMGKDGSIYCFSNRGLYIVKNIISTFYPYDPDLGGAASNFQMFLSSPVIAADGTLYCISREGILYALKR